MANAADPLRRTLDTQAVAPDAAGDRPYLESMLRRLGYSDAEIAAYISGQEAPAKAAPASVAGRDIELEYTGPGLREFQLVIGVDESELPALGGMEAGTEVFAAGPSMEEVDALVAQGGFGDFDDWGDSGKPADEAGSSDFGETGGEGSATAEAGESGESGGLASEGSAGAATVPTEFQLGEGMVEFKASDLDEAVVEPLDPAGEAQALKEQGWEVADLESGKFPGEGEALEPAAWTGEPASDAGGFQEGTWDSGAQDGFAHNDWKLYSRDELRGDTPQRIYFFSQEAPEGGVPAEVPDGYEVAENPETGRPFLRRALDEAPGGLDIDNVGTTSEGSSDPQAPKKRVRIQRVRAASREEATRKLQAEGRNVLGSMPIDIEKRMGDE